MKRQQPYVAPLNVLIYRRALRASCLIRPFTTTRLPATFSPAPAAGLFAAALLTSSAASVAFRARHDRCGRWPVPYLS